MKCLYPFIAPGRKAYPCGQCLPCRLNRRRLWTHRIILEAKCHDDSSFCTLTYRDAPERNSLCPRTLSLFLKRLRRRVSPAGIRYYCVGEYGDDTGRPHYHAALFGFPSCRGGIVKIVDGGRLCQCHACMVIRESWGLGHTVLGPLELASARYIAGYVVKKMTNPSDSRLAGRHPEFARMSLRPGIGAEALWEVASSVMQYGLEGRADVPGALRHGAAVLPLGRYLRRRLRSLVGLPPDAPESTVEECREQLRSVFEAADLVIPKGMGKFKNMVVAAAIGAENEQGGHNEGARSLKSRRPI